MHRNSHTLALGRFGAFALVGAIFVSLFAAGVRANGLAGAAPPKSEPSADYIHYVITDDKLPALISSTSSVASIEKPIADVISLRESFDEPQFGVRDNYDIVEINGCSTFSSLGKPVLPAKTIFVLLPYGKELSNVRVRSSGQMLVKNGLYLYPGQKPIPLGTSFEEFTPPDAGVYSSRANYPSKLYNLEFVTGYRGYVIAAIRLFPVQYVPAERVVIYHPKIEVEVELTTATEQRRFYPAEDVEEWIRANVKNPEVLSSYVYSPNPRGDAEYLIITRPMFTSVMQPLVDLKSQRMTVQVKTVDSIVASYSGRDVPEKIRNCIIDYRNNHGTRWVLLAGDEDNNTLDMWGTPNYVLNKPWEIPTRYLWNPASDDSYYTNKNWNYQPTDYYYAGLDGDWDADGDGRFGESAYESSTDEADWFADVYVGRFPAQDVSTMENIVRKTVAYETNPDKSIEILLLGAELFDPELAHDYAYYYCGKTIKRNIKDNLISWPDNVREYYWDTASDDHYGICELNEENFIKAVNTYDPLIVNSVSHGTPTSMLIFAWTDTPFIDVETPKFITNSGFLYYTPACLTNAFDIRENCIGEAMLQDNDGGAIGYIGHTRVGWFVADLIDFYTWGSNGQDFKFFEEVFQNAEFHQGAALYKSKMDYITSGWYYNFSDAPERACLFVTMLLGDPELSFVPDPIPPAAPELVSPCDNTIIGDTTPTFKWENVKDYTRVTYKLQVDDNPEFSSPEIDESGLIENTYTMPSVSALGINKAYYWRVRAVDGVLAQTYWTGNVGEWSDVRQFDIVEIHGPIYIDSDEDFTLADFVRSGSGTSIDPYIISGWDIDAAGGASIYITDTTAYFRISNCHVYSGYEGIVLNDVVNGRIEDVIVENNWKGVSLYGSSLNNTITNCTIKNNDYGVYSSASSNTIYRNKFTGNDKQAYDSGSNSWDYGSEGNYWSNYTGSDGTPLDGIGSAPYLIPGGNNQDHYPLMGVGNTSIIPISPADGEVVVDLSFLGELEFDAVNGWESNIIHVAGEVYAVAYTGPDWDGFVRTFRITSSGVITSTGYLLEFDAVNCGDPNIIHVAGEVYAVAYRGPDDDGFVKTVRITSSGVITSTGYSLGFTNDCQWVNIIHVAGGVYAIAYRNNSAIGWLATVQITGAGEITIIGNTIFEGRECWELNIVNVSDDVFAIAYRGHDENGHVITIEIKNDGRSIKITDLLELDVNRCNEPNIIQVSGEVFAIAYMGDYDDGYMKTVVVDNKQTLIWQGVVDYLTPPVTYELQVADEDTFIQPMFAQPLYSVKDLSTNQHKIAKKLAAGTYYWRVRTMDGSGKEGDWSNVWKFTIDVPIQHHEAIAYSDEDFTIPNGVRCGSGTKNDPYIISSWDIIPYERTCISSLATTVYHVIRNCNLEEGEISIIYSKNCKIKNVTVRNVIDLYLFAGIWFGYSLNNFIENCDIFASVDYSDGILLDGSYNNTISRCTIDVYDEGIYIGGSGNVVSNCTIKNNNYGIYSSTSTNNLIYHNKFINNTTPAHDEGSNYWDNNYPSGGNYWSNHVGVDNYSGPGQNEPWPDGIIDMPYSITGGSNWDNYPLMAFTNITPVLTSPVGGSTVGAKPTFRWREVIDRLDPPVTYELQVDTQSSFTSPLVYSKTGITENQHKIENSLTLGTYYWRVSAINGLSQASNWSAVWQFTVVDATSPSIPSLSYPIDGAVMNDDTPTFTWSTVADPSGVTYDLQVDDNPDFSSLVINESGWGSTTYDVQNALSNDIYYWCVRAVDGAGNPSLWSEVWQFTIDAPVHGVWVQTTWAGGRTTPALQVGTWNDDYNNYYVGENESNTGGELKIAPQPLSYENGMKITGSEVSLGSMTASGHKTSIRFTAQENENVDKIRVFLHSENGASPAYTYGIQADSGGYPTGTWLGSANSTATSAGWKTVNITNVAIVAGNVYHIVVQPSGTPSASNYIALRALNTLTQIIPFDGRVDGNANTLFYGASWSLKNYDSIYVLDYTDGTYRGQPYDTPLYGSPIYGGLCGGERFTIHEDKLLTSVGFYIKKVGSPLDNLYYILYDIDDGENKFVLTVTAGEVSTSYSWVEKAVTPIQFIAGHSYRLYVASPGSNASNYYVDAFRGVLLTEPYLRLSYYGENSCYDSRYGGVWSYAPDYDVLFYMKLPTYYPRAYIESSIYDSGSYADWENVSWNASAPTGTSITVKVRSGGDNNPYDGGWSDWCVHENNTENALLSNSRYVQYRIELSTTDNTKTPKLFEIQIYMLTSITPSLVSPANGETISDDTPTFEWTNVFDPSGVTYDLQVDTHSDFSSPEINASGLANTTYTVPGENALPENTYYWRVRAVDGADNPSLWSEVWQFIINATPQLTRIYIPSDADFTAANGVTGGSGTVNDPYIIEGWEFDASAPRPDGPAGAIDIRNTTKYFIIRNCYIHGGRESRNALWGITLYNVRNGTIRNSRIFSTWGSIYIYESEFVTIDNNWVENTGGGIAWGVENMGGGITINGFPTDHSTSCDVINNTVRNSAWMGVRVTYDTGITVRNNVIDNAHGNPYLWYGGGIWVAGGATDVLVEYNTITNCDPYGISPYNCHNVTIRYNEIENSAQQGITVKDGADPTNMRIYLNNIRNSGLTPQGKVMDGDFSINGNVIWDNGTHGNYWSDWTTPDANGDGIVDNRYILAGAGGNWDNYPLTQPYQNYLGSFGREKRVKPLSELLSVEQLPEPHPWKTV